MFLLKIMFEDLTQRGRKNIHLNSHVILSDMMQQIRISNSQQFDANKLPLREEKSLKVNNKAVAPVVREPPQFGLRSAQNYLTLRVTWIFSFSS